MMTGVELAVGYSLAWMFGKGRRAAGQLDAEVDRVTDAGLRHVHDLVSGALGETAALAQARQAAAGRSEADEQLRLQLVQAVAEQAERDPAFGEALQQAVAAVRDQPESSPLPTSGVASSVQNNHGTNVTGGQIGDITINPQPPGPARS